MSRKALGSLLLAALAVALALATAPYLHRFLCFVVFLLVTPFAYVVVPILCITACAFLGALLRLFGWSSARSWGGAAVVVGVVAAFLVVDARRAPANVWGTNPEAHPTKGVVAPALHWILEHSEESRNSPWAASDVQKSYGAQMSLTARIVEVSPGRCLIKGMITNRGKGVVRNAVVQTEVTDARNRTVGGWRSGVVDFDPPRVDGDHAPLHPGESREFEVVLPLAPSLFRKGELVEPLTLTVTPSDLMIEKFPGVR